MNQTTNYALNQWEEGDRVSRADFNSDNSKLDAAIKSVADTAASAQSAASAAQSAVSSAAKLAAGSYVGDDAESRTISVGFTPKAVLVMAYDSELYVAYDYGNTFGGLATTGSPVKVGTLIAVEVCTGGFRVHKKDQGYYHVTTNANGFTYNYIALG